MAGEKQILLLTQKNGTEQEWLLEKPTHEFEKHHRGGLVLPNYSKSVLATQASLTSGSVNFAVPRRPESELGIPHVPIPDYDLCETCEEVEIQNMLGRTNGRSYELGWAMDIFFCDSCALCRLITASILLESAADEDLITSLEDCYIILKSDPATWPIRKGRERKSQLSIIVLKAATSQMICMPLIRLLDQDAPEINKSPLFFGRQIDSSLADMRSARRWIADCDEGHECSRHADPKISIPGLLVIDVRRNCLVELPASSRYVALSYVWPKFETLLLQKAKVEQFKAPGFFTTVSSQLPKVIQDALQVVRDLDETHIWIDALCIIQDDMVAKTGLIGRMDKVYTAAYLTVIAASSADPQTNYPIPGIGAPRAHQQSVAEVDGVRLVTAFPNYNASLEMSRWSKRGWTFQEGILSPRCLIFTDHQMYFRCTRDARCEDVVAEAQDPYDEDKEDTESYDVHPAKPRFRESRVDFLLNSEFLQKIKDRDWFDEYAHLVCDFSKRSLTFEADVHSAFKGIMNSMSPHVGGTGFFCGHPFSQFNKSLLWYPTSEARRRDVHVAPDYPYPNPSWSWTGWVGSVDFEAGLPNLNDEQQAHLPTVGWHRWSEYGLVPVRDSWHKYQPLDPFSEDAFALSRLWYQARLIRDPTQIMSWCSTVNMSFELPESFIQDWVSDLQQFLPCFTVQDADGDPCGFLPSVDRKWAREYKDRGGGACELVVLSIAPKSFKAELRTGTRFIHKKYPVPKEFLTCFLYVMLIERGDGPGNGAVSQQRAMVRYDDTVGERRDVVEYNNRVAYRRGVGLIHREAVDTQGIFGMDRKILILG